MAVTSSTRLQSKITVLLDCCLECTYHVEVIFKMNQPYLATGDVEDFAVGSSTCTSLSYSLYCRFSQFNVHKTITTLKFSWKLGLICKKSANFHMVFHFFRLCQLKQSTEQMLCPLKNASNFCCLNIQKKPRTNF